ncbi:MAG: cupin domain-containing protein [Acidobacteriota bacterium]
MAAHPIDPRAQELIDGLDLRPHPEGGFFRAVFRSVSSVQPDDERAVRAAATSIYFLLTGGTHSRWHRVRSDEVWHLYEGGPLELFLAPPDCTEVRRFVLGPSLASDGPTCTVPADWWQAAKPVGPYALTGCTVAPGFDFEDFTFLHQVPSVLAQLMKVDPRCAEFV